MLANFCHFCIRELQSAVPCCNSWDDFLTPNTPEYSRAEAELRAKLQAVIHVVDYYYLAFGHQLPQLPERTKIDPERQPKSKKEMAIREMICRHLACDGVDFCTLYDFCSLLNPAVPQEHSYLAVIWPSAHLMRTDPGKFYLKLGNQ